MCEVIDRCHRSKREDYSPRRHSLSISATWAKTFRRSYREFRDCISQVKRLNALALHRNLSRRRCAHLARLRDASENGASWEIAGSDAHDQRIARRSASSEDLIVPRSSSAISQIPRLPRLGGFRAEGATRMHTAVATASEAFIESYPIPVPRSPNSSGSSASSTKRLRASPPPKPTPKRTSKTPAPSSKATSNPSSPSAARGGWKKPLGDVRDFRNGINVHQGQQRREHQNHRRVRNFQNELRLTPPRTLILSRSDGELS